MPLPVLAAPSSAVAPPSHSIVITGTGVTAGTTWPAFDASIDRYAVPTTAQTRGSLVVTATTSDPTGVVRVDGMEAHGPVTVSGLAPGDEVNVQIADSGPPSNQSFVYLPADFPRLAASTTGEAAPGGVFLGI